MEKQATSAVEKKRADVLSFYRLYKLSSSSTSFSLYVDKNKLPNSYTDLEAFFYKNNFILNKKDWTEDSWKKAYSYLHEQAQKNTITNKMIKLDELPHLLNNAKIIITSFLLADDNELPLIINEFMPKPLNESLNRLLTGLNRLFTYALFELIIKIRNLTHIRLPKKVLVIQDKETKRYVSYKEAQAIIDDNLKIYIDRLGSKWDKEVNFEILFSSDKYNLKLFAKKELMEGRGLSLSAFRNLVDLCREVPFDIGYDNIFWDAKGDAIIIDTEFKGESSDNACPKLNRYPIDRSLQ